jgi:hypothetical protein
VNAILVAASEVLAWLAENHWPACVIGGLAVQRWGEPRLTQDVDVTVVVALGSEERMLDAALSHFAPRREDARAFAELKEDPDLGRPFEQALDRTRRG